MARSRRIGTAGLLISPTKTREALLVGIIVVFAMGVGIHTPSFLGLGNLSEIVINSDILVLVAVAQTAVILTKQIDLSVGSVMGLTCMIVGVTASDHRHLPVIVLVLLGAALGAAFGTINAVFIAFVGIPSIIVTLATLEIYRGAIPAIAYSVFTYQLPQSVISLTRGSILGVPRMDWYALIAVVTIGYIVSQTRTGRQLYAMGSNPDGAVLSGIRVRMRTFWLFVLSGTVAGIAGVLWLSFYAAAETSSALGWEFQTVAANIIGGVNIWGGSGSVVGVVLGALLLSGVANALVLQNISVNWQQAVDGAVLLVAVSFNVVLTRRTRNRMAIKQVAETERVVEAELE